jgi:ferrous iron transport protein A
MSKTLKEVKVGEKVNIRRIIGTGPVKRRLMDMGVTKGQEILVRKVAPLGDPIEVNLRGYELTFRKEEAENILVE